jgi:hypothetical protein
MSMESETVALLADDLELGVLLPGGVYSYMLLGDEGITDRKTTPDVWAGGEFQATVVVRQRAPVPTGDLQSIRSQRVSYSQAVEVWVYALTAEEIEAALNRIYALMMGKRLTAAFSAVWAGSGPSILQSPELPPGIKNNHEDYRLVSIRRAVAVI